MKRNTQHDNAGATERFRARVTPAAAAAVFATLLFLWPAGAASASPDAGKDLGTLDEINIEGEIPLPQVLFISSREQPRWPDEVHKRYLAGLDSWLARPIFPIRIITAPKGLDQQEEF